MTYPRIFASHWLGRELTGTHRRRAPGVRTAARVGSTPTLQAGKPERRVHHIPVHQRYLSITGLRSPSDGGGRMQVRRPRAPTPPHLLLAPGAPTVRLPRSPRSNGDCRREGHGPCAASSPTTPRARIPRHRHPSLASVFTHTHAYIYTHRPLRLPGVVISSPPLPPLLTKRHWGLVVGWW
jgi:hypothetical protein